MKDPVTLAMYNCELLQRGNVRIQNINESKYCGNYCMRLGNLVGFLL